MKKSLQGLTDFIGNDEIVRVERKPLERLDGFVIAVSEKLLLLQVIEGNNLLSQGYSVLRLADIHSFRVDTTFVTRALRLLERKPIMLDGVDISTFPHFVTWVRTRYPMILIETEKKEPDICFIGPVIDVTVRAVTIHKIGTEAESLGVEMFAFKDITRIEFDNGYINALSLTVEHEANIVNISP